MKFFKNPIGYAEKSAIGALGFLLKYASAQTTDSPTPSTTQETNDILLGLCAGLLVLTICAYHCCRRKPEHDYETYSIIGSSPVKAPFPEADEQGYGTTPKSYS